MSGNTISPPLTITEPVQERRSGSLGLVTLMAISIGMVIVQGTMISATQGIGLGGMGFIAAMILALIISMFNAMTFSELSLMFPQEGTLATYTQKAIGHFPAILAVFSGYVVVAILAIPVEMFMVDMMLRELLPGIFPEKVIPILFLGLLVATNLVGMDLFSRIQNLLALIMVSTMALLGLIAITGTSEPHPQLTGTPVDWSFAHVLDGSFIGLTALAMWLMVGFENVCPMINDIKDPNKNLPRSMFLSLLAIFFIFLIFVIGANFYLNTETLIGAEIPYLDYANAVFGKSGLLIATIMALTATCSTMNTVLAAIPRMLHGMAMQGQAFPQLKASNRFGAPWAAILMLAVSTTIPYLWMDVDSLILLVIAATTSYLLAYIIANINVIVLRKRMPDHPRPYRTPFYPLPQILSIVAMLYVALNNAPSPDMTLTIYGISGAILLILGTVTAIWVRFYMKRRLFEPDED